MTRAIILAKKYLLLIIAIVIILALALVYELGYRVGPGISIERVGTLTLTNLPKGTSVYIDQTFRTTTTATSSVREELIAGNHSIIVSVPTDYPWSTLVSMTSGEEATVQPIFVTMSPNVTPLSGSDKTAAISAIASSTLPTFANPLHLANNCAIVYVSNNQVIADTSTTTPGCTPPPYLCTGASCGPTIIFSPVTPLKFVQKFPGRQDALVVQINTILYALALDPRSPQFFAPILTGTEPVVGSLQNGTIVVQNGAAVYRVNL